MNPFQRAMHALIQEYVDRQQLVIACIQDYRPYLLAPNSETYQRLSKMSPRRRSIGRWGSEREWHYYFHGIGCCLSHTITQEPIEWDAMLSDEDRPHKERFNAGWFENWVKWYIHKHDDKVASIIRDVLEDRRKNLTRTPFIPNSLDELVELGVLRFHPVSTARYELLTRRGHQSRG